MTTRDWMATYSGLKFNPKEPDPKKIRIEDIAHHLSLVSRFGGATSKLCSVAQHSVLVSMYVERDGYSKHDSLWGLLHDAAEAYIGDMVKNVKELFPEFKKLEDDLLQPIINKFGLSWPIPQCVKDWDWIIGCNEAFTFIKGGKPKFFGVDPVRKVYITQWSATYAEEMFLNRFDILTSKT